MDDARDLALLAMRPVIAFTPAADPVENFQHAVLRPLLKLQHPLLVQQFEAQVVALKLPWDRMPAAERRATVQHLVQTHHRLRASLGSLVTALMTQTEFSFYLTHQAALNKRLGTLLVARLQSVYP